MFTTARKTLIPIVNAISKHIKVDWQLTKSTKTV